MAKFNTKRTIGNTLASEPTLTVNHEGAIAFELDPLTDLCLKATTSLVGEPKFYETSADADDSLLKATHEALEIDPEFVLQLAVYCREKMYLRSVPLMLVAEYANVTPGTVPDARKYIARVIQRADELTELTSYQLKRNLFYPRKSKLPMALKFGMADAFNKFNDYKLAKYNRPGTVTLKDVLRLVRPIAKNKDQKETFNRLYHDTLPIPETWEMMRMTGKMTWHEVVNNVFNKGGHIMNYMAQLRNIRNVMKNDTITPDDITLLTCMLSHKNAVLKSKQFPFRFLTAHRIVEKEGGPYANELMDALEIAVSYSTENMPKLPGTTLIACDVSGSMEQSISDGRGHDSIIERYDIGILLGTIANTFCSRSITGIFGDIWKTTPMSKISGILSNTTHMRNVRNRVGYSTNGHEIIRYLVENDISVDRIFIFTDNQFWNSHRLMFTRNQDFDDFFTDRSFAAEFMKYQRKNPNVKLYVFDLAGYGDMVIPQKTRNVCMIGGWSDRIFEFIPKFEEDPSMMAMVDEVRKIKLE